MRLTHGRAAYVAAGLAAVLAVAGTTAVQAQGTTKVPGDKVSTAKSTVVAHSARFGFGPDQQLQAAGVFTDKAGSAVRFDRTYRGLPVVGGDFVVHITPSGAYRYGNGMKVVALPKSITAQVSAAAAATKAAAQVRYTVATSSTKLVVFATASSSSLAWQVSTASKGGRDGDVTYVSATTGSTLASWPTVVNDSGDTATPYAGSRDVGVGKTLYSGHVTLPDVERHAGVTRYVLKDRTRGVQRVYDAHNGEITAGTLFKDENNVWGDGTEANRETAGADAAYALANTWDYYLNTYNRRGIADDGVAAKAYVHVYQDYVNASWSDSCFCMRFGDGSQASGISALTSIDVGGHEMTHGVTSRTAKLIYSGESGGLNESTSDVMGTSVEWYANNSHDVPDYVIGEQIFRDYNPATNYIRRMDKPSMDGLSKDCWYAGVGNVDVHYSSGVGNHLFYLLSEGSGAKKINGIDYNSPTCDGSTIRGIGHEKAAAIWYKALTENWVSTTDYHEARTGMLQAAKDLYGQDSTEYKTLDKAWAAVNVS